MYSFPTLSRPREAGNEADNVPSFRFARQLDSELHNKLREKETPFKDVDNLLIQ